MDKVELAKMIGLEITGYEQNISKYEIKNLLEDELMVISETFSGGVEIEVHQEDLDKDMLDIKLSDLEDDGDIKVCIKQIKALLWERAAEQYLERVHNAAMLVGKQL